MNRLACCYHPTSILIVDDEKTYVDTLHLKFKRNLPCKTYTNPKDALNFLLNDYHFDALENRWIKRSKENYQHLDIDLPAIRQEAYNPNRFEQISILVVDQVMPGLKGLDLCRQLGQTNIQKILLTGKVTDADAIDAFNDKLINKYIAKHSPDLMEKLTLAIEELMLAYFINLSRTTLLTLSKNPEYAFLNNEDFIKFFHDFIKENHIVEYYLCDAHSFMFLDKDANPSWLSIKTEIDPTLNHGYEFQEGDKKYYCTPIKNSKAHEIDQSKILPYSAYLKNAI
jgi:CheY-like chemotaxis protein